MNPPSYGTEDRSASLEDITASESAANSESSEEEREEEVRAIPADPAPIASASPAPIASETPASAGDTRTQPGTVPRPASLSLASSDELQLWTSRRDGEVKLRVSESGPASEPPITVHQMFTSTVERYGAYPALGWKEGDQWKTLNYKDYYQQCRTAAKGFLKQEKGTPGVVFGADGRRAFGSVPDRVAPWGPQGAAWESWASTPPSGSSPTSPPSWLAGSRWASTPPTPRRPASTWRKNCQANILVVENHKQLQKILQVQDKLPHLKAIIQYKDELKEKRPNLFTWAEFMELGQEVSDSQLDDIISSQKPNQCCTLIYTSGTTGQPKGVMLSHDNLTWTAFGAGRHVRLTEASVLQEVVVSYLPLSHIAAQMIDIWLIMKVGGVSYFAQPDALKGSLANTLREIRPTAFMGVPRVWEKMQEKMKSVGAKSSAVRRKVAAWAKDVGLSTNLSRMQRNGETTDREPLNYRLARKLVFRKVRKALGLDRCSKCYTGAAPITKDTLEFFLSLDVPVYELYGMSESTGPHTVSLPDAFRLTSCGKVIPGCETKIFRPDEEGNGEICFWGRHVFMGYLNSADKTEEALDSDGWLHSGDLGKHDEQDFLFITGRIKELIITAGGENIPPVPIEDEVKAAVPLISNAMLIGDKRKFLTMLLTIKSQVNEDSGAPEDELTEEAVALCQRLGSSATRVSEIAGGRDRAVHAAIQEGINRVNEHATSNAQRIQKWTVLDRDFSILGGELGPTMKLKRPVVMKMYKEQIENFYKEVATPTTPDNPLPPK
ncbi:hypothetical protein ANANG_G00093740 [Anguilla anguilla]|uniref:Long-chain-fatty-acid--CoA ligase ACSBG2 n=1 Tax=Anguilla anguilla TaxID=7936 RepID=A0A9D3MP57_ANGAN|nr:hypothetical protein ANANG_G00093740 [Anguilla anguilla]